MAIARYAALTFIVFICAMPLKRGNMLRNEVTPAPPADHMMDVFGLDELNLEQQPLTTLAPPVKQDTYSNKDSPIAETAQTTEPPVQQPDNKHEEDVRPTNIKEKILQPVCLYDFQEIFLFQHRTGSTDNTQQKHTFIANVTKILHYAEKTTETVANETEHSQGTQTEREEIGHTVDKTDDPKKVKLEADTMQSFEEWKSLKLQEQEVRKAEELLTPPAHIVRTKKTQVNYASQDCGAKILSSNKEAKLVSAILDENRDMYMLNPCSANIWFVIELCEPIQVEQLQLCNLELFSSAPKDFIVSVSERYPAREWHSLGTFHASNDRTLQTFVSKNEEQMFAKYIKFEMQSHFSNEHFCPLTLVRVLGVSMVDEFDESEQSNNKEDISDETNIENQQQEGNKDGAINTMFNMVKNAVGQVLSNGAENNADEAPAGTQPNKSDDDTTDPAVESEVFLVTNETEVASAFVDNVTQDFITLIKTGNGEDISEYLKNFSRCSSRRIPLYVPKLINLFNPLTTKLNVHMCWFLEFFCKVSLAGCLVHYPYNYSCLGLFIPLQGLNFRSSDVEDKVPKLSGPGIKSDDNASGSPALRLPPSENTNANNGAAGSSSVKKAVGTKNKTGDQTNRTAIDPPNPDTGQKKASEEIAVSDPSETTKEPCVDASTKADATGDSVVGKEDVIYLGPKDSSQLPPQPATSKDGEDKANPKTSDADEANVVPQHSISEPVAVEPNITQNATAKTPSANDTVKNTSGSNSTHSQPTVVINPGTNQKDSVFMRLSNRIRVLEQNMSLSSDYLETLSQRYKKQMDEMQRAFNQTTSKLLSMSRAAKESDARQNDSIQIAFAEIKMLTGQLKNLSLSHDQLNMQLVERHLCLIILEFLIFIVVFVTCLGRRVSQIQNDLNRSEKMNKDLMKVLKRFENDPKLRPAMKNGHCVAKDHRSDGLPARGLRRKKSRGPDGRRPNKGIKQKGVDVVMANGMKGDPKSFSEKEVEVIDKDQRWSVDERSCSGRGGWDGHPLALKLPKGHSKGRK